ncbi:MAG TPA: copper homeostasis protein CutC [Bauldia sp.]|nr:copper homeostasis protein CutC [Bauldia sp.]
MSERLADRLRFEICVDSIAGVVAAREAGADRVELCASLIEGGITPSLGMIRRAREVKGIGLHVIIRPRGGDFLYGPEELEVMEADIDAAKAEGADGIVFGMLDADGNVDIPATERLIARARPAAVTFHRAFDMTPDPFAALETLIALGVERVLTSGQEPSVLEGADTIAALVEAAGDRIVVMPGGGINARNAARIVAMTGARELHFAALAPVESGMRFRRRDVFMGGTLRPPEYERLDTAVGDIAAVIAAARG